MIAQPIGARKVGRIVPGRVYFRLPPDAIGRKGVRGLRVIELLIGLLTALILFAAAVMQYAATAEKRKADRDNGEKTRRNGRATTQNRRSR